MSDDMKFTQKAGMGQRMNASMMGSMNTGFKRIWYSFVGLFSSTWELNMKLRRGLRHATLDIKHIKEDPQKYFNSFIKDSIDEGDIPKLEGGILKFVGHLRTDAFEEENAADALIMTIAMEQGKIHHVVRTIIDFANRNHEAFKSFSKNDRQTFKEMLENLAFIEKNMAERMDKLFNLWLSFGRDRMRLRLLGTQISQAFTIDLQNMNTKMFAGNRMKASSKHAFKELNKILNELNNLSYVLELKNKGSAPIMSRSLQQLKDDSKELRKEFESQGQLAVNVEYNIIQDLFFIIDKVPNAILVSLDHLTKEKGLPEAERQKIAQLLKNDMDFQEIMSNSLKLAYEARDTAKKESDDGKELQSLVHRFA